MTLDIQYQHQSCLLHRRLSIKLDQFNSSFELCYLAVLCFYVFFFSQIQQQFRFSTQFQSEIPKSFILVTIIILYIGLGRGKIHHIRILGLLYSQWMSHAFGSTTPLKTEIFIIVTFFCLSSMYQVRFNVSDSLNSSITTIHYQKHCKPKNPVRACVCALDLSVSSEPFWGHYI